MDILVEYYRQFGVLKNNHVHSLSSMTMVKQNRCLGNSYSGKRFWFSRHESLVFGNPLAQTMRIIDRLILDMVEQVVKNVENDNH